MPEEQKDDQLKLMRTMAELAAERTKMAKIRTKMSSERSEMSAHRSELSAQRTYMNTERTLSVWIRTALAAMIFGIAIDRLGLLLEKISDTTVHFWFVQGTPSTVTGAILVISSMFIAVSATIRFVGFAFTYRKKHTFPAHHKPFLPVLYALLIVIFGGVLLALMIGFI